MKNARHLLIVLFCFAATTAILFTPGFARSQPSGKGYTCGQLEHFFDTLAPRAMEEQHVPGVVIAVMSSDSLVFTKGYGYADLENQKPVDPRKTVWRLASIAKVVTGTAVMQLVEEGRADLNTDINEYLDSLEIPEKFGRPITLRHLLTHTAGFDDRYLNKSFRTQKARPSLNAFLKDIMPERIYPPGQIYTYSNIGNALAALVVEDITGEDFNTYCRQNIFLPLGMDHTSFRRTSRMKPNLYHGYIYQEGNHQEVPFDYLGDYPAGQLLSPATEFARFMMCHLQNGTYKGARILSASTARQMHSPQFTHHPKLNGSVGYTFHISEERGNKTISHNGGYAGLSTRMLLLPEQKTGIFIACNRSSGLVNTLSGAFVKKYFNNQADSSTTYPLEDLPEYNREVDQFTGYYRGTRYTHNDFTKVYLLSGAVNDVKIWKNEEGMLMMYDQKGSPRRLIQTEPGLFRSIDDDYYIAFKMNGKGHPEYLFTHGTGALEKIAPFWSNQIQLRLFGTILGFFLLMLLVRFIYRLVPAGRKKLFEQPVGMKKIRRLSSLTGGLLLLHWLLMYLVLFVFNPAWELTQTGLAYGIPWGMYIVQMVPLAALVSLLFYLYRIIRNYPNPQLPVFSKIFATLFLIISAGYMVMLNYWNLLGFHFG
mgnify:CR=1 FL=1